MTGLLRTATVAAVAVLPVTAVAQNLFAGQWFVHDGASPVTGKRTVLISTTAHGLQTPFGGMFLLGIRCAPGRRGHELQVLVELGRHTSAMSGCVAYKADNDAPQEDCGYRASNDRGYFLANPAGFTKSLIGKRKLLMEIPTASAGRVVAEFTVSGIEKHLASLKPQCEVR
jgi:hypothetical protein